MTERPDEIAARITGVRQLGVVIGAMRSIAAARALQARDLVAGVETYAGVVAQALGTALSLLPEPEVQPQAADAPHALVVFCAEQGFAGGYTARMLDAARDTAGPVLLVGNRGLALAGERNLQPVWTTAMAPHADAVATVAARIADVLYDRLRQDELPAIDLLVPVWAAGAVTVTRRALLPLDRSLFVAAPGPPPLTTLPADNLVAGLLAEYVNAELCRAAMNAFVAENEARAQVLAAARGAIGTMLDDLTARERQVRQEGITAEVVELARATTARAVGDLRAAGLTSGGG